MPGFVFGPCGVLPPLPSWTPASVTTAFWYDASNFASITQSGGTVSQWNDLSGNARNLAQATIGNQPAYATGVLNGLPGLHFINTTSGATSSVMGTASFAQSQILTTVMAFKTTGIVYDTSGNMGSNGKILEGDPVGGAGGTRLVVFGAISSGHANYSAGVGVDAGASLAANTGYHWGIIYNGASSSSDLSGTTSSGNTSAGGIVSGLVVGGQSATLFIDLYMCELFAITSASAGQATIDLANALAYINAKWGV